MVTSEAPLVVTTQEGDRGVTSIQWAEAREAAQHPCRAQDSPTTKDCLAPSVNRAEVEKPRSRVNTRVRGHSQSLGNSGPLAKSPVVCMAFCSSFSIAGLRSSGSNEEPACRPGGKSRPSTGCRILQHASAAVAGKSRPQLGLKRKVWGWKVRQGKGSQPHYVLKKSFFRRKLKQPGICL